LYQHLKNVDENRLYHHIIEMMGPNDPVYNQDKLDAAADYIVSQFDEYGLQVYEHVFEIDGKRFRNIEGVIDTGEGPELLLTSHYDTVPQAPGADDNLSSVSAMLESARILAEADDPLNLRFIGFTLEEGHPDEFQVTNANAQNLGLMDEYFNFKNLNTMLLSKEFWKHYRQGRSLGREYKDSIDLFFEENRDKMNKNELSYFNGMKEFFGVITTDSWVGNHFLIGSGKWVEEKSKNLEIVGVINLEMIGYFSQKPHSQRLPDGFSSDILQRYLVDDPYVGNYLMGVADVNSGSLLELFASCCKLDGVNLPFIWLQVPFGYDVINKNMFDLLRADHTPFWKENIPAILLSDSANFRTPYYHTPADTIDKLDFNYIAKVCKASIATALKSPTLTQ